ncbi:unnamed protein product [Owenia fusiformis]|uniref:Insulin receptor substrate 1 n=1 Tax=Owenia fusiformis TaxID=6347 RepID=A0A8J1USG4_OWEFU|nr:unnamed protein product [Owenia fusiformis]
MDHKKRSESKKSLSKPGGDIRKCGYLKKLKTMKKKFFVLRHEIDDQPACLEYHDTEKKFKTGHAPKRRIDLPSCLSINRKSDPRHKYAIAIYTKDDCFSVLCDSESGMEEWLTAMLEMQSEQVEGAEPLKPLFEHVWQVSVRNKGLGSSKNLVGTYRLCLTNELLTLVKLNNDKPEITFQLASIRRCGHTDCFFCMEVGRSSATGQGELWMQVEDAIIAQNMHEAILSSMKKIDKEQMQMALPKFRTRSHSSATDKGKLNTSGLSVRSGGSSPVPYLPDPALAPKRSKTISEGQCGSPRRHRITPKSRETTSELRPVSMFSRAHGSHSPHSPAGSPLVSIRGLEAEHRARSDSMDSRGSHASSRGTSSSVSGEEVDGDIMLRSMTPDINEDNEQYFHMGFHKSSSESSTTDTSSIPGYMDMRPVSQTIPTPVLKGPDDYIDMSPASTPKPYMEMSMGKAAAPDAKEGYMEMTPSTTPKSDTGAYFDMSPGVAPTQQSPYLDMSVGSSASNTPSSLILGTSPSRRDIISDSGGYFDMSPMSHSLPTVCEKPAAVEAGYMDMTPKMAHKDPTIPEVSRPDRVTSFLVDDGSLSDFRPKSFSVGSRPLKKIHHQTAPYMEAIAQEGSLERDNKSSSAPHLTPDQQMKSQSSSSIPAHASSMSGISSSSSGLQSHSSSMQSHRDMSDLFMEMEFNMRPRTSSDTWSQQHRPRTGSDSYGQRPRASSFTQKNDLRPRSSSYGQKSTWTKPQRRRSRDSSMSSNISMDSQELQFSLNTSHDSMPHMASYSSSESLGKTSTPRSTHSDYIGMGGPTSSPRSDFLSATGIGVSPLAVSDYMSMGSSSSSSPPKHSNSKPKSPGPGSDVSGYMIMSPPELPEPGDVHVPLATSKLSQHTRHSKHKPKTDPRYPKNSGRDKPGLKVETSPLVRASSLPSPGAYVSLDYNTPKITTPRTEQHKVKSKSDLLAADRKNTESSPKSQPTLPLPSRTQNTGAESYVIYSPGSTQPKSTSPHQAIGKPPGHDYVNISLSKKAETIEKSGNSQVDTSEVQKRVTKRKPVPSVRKSVKSKSKIAVDDKTQAEDSGVKATDNSKNTTGAPSRALDAYADMSHVNVKKDFMQTNVPQYELKAVEPTNSLEKKTCKDSHNSSKKTIDDAYSEMGPFTKSPSSVIKDSSTDAYSVMAPFSLQTKTPKVLVSASKDTNVDAYSEMAPLSLQTKTPNVFVSASKDTNVDAYSEMGPFTSQTKTAKSPSSVIKDSSTDAYSVMAPFSLQTKAPKVLVSASKDTNVDAYSEMAPLSLQTKTPNVSSSVSKDTSFDAYSEMTPISVQTKTNIKSPSSVTKDIYYDAYSEMPSSKVSTTKDNSSDEYSEMAPMSLQTKSSKVSGSASKESSSDAYSEMTPVSLQAQSNLKKDSSSDIYSEMAPLSKSVNKEAPPMRQDMSPGLSSKIPHQSSQEDSYTEMAPINKKGSVKIGKTDVKISMVKKGAMSSPKSSSALQKGTPKATSLSPSPKPDRATSPLTQRLKAEGASSKSPTTSKAIELSAKKAGLQPNLQMTPLSIDLGTDIDADLSPRSDASPRQATISLPRVRSGGSLGDAIPKRGSSSSLSSIGSGDRTRHFSGGAISKQSSLSSTSEDSPGIRSPKVSSLSPSIMFQAKSPRSSLGEKELNYAALDLSDSLPPKSPLSLKSRNSSNNSEDNEPLSYAKIDFEKSGKPDTSRFEFELL